MGMMEECQERNGDSFLEHGSRIWEHGEWIGDFFWGKIKLEGKANLIALAPHPSHVFLSI